MILQRAIPALKDIRCWIVLFFLVRLIGITDPPIETNHSWRQSFTCMVTRNMVEVSSNPLYPRTDLAGNRPDIVASEFPGFNLLIALTSKLFGYTHWYGRLINLICSSIGVWCFYLIIRRYFGNNPAFFAGCLLLLSVWFTFSRKIMPDTFSLSMVITGLWFLSKYLDVNKIIFLVLFLLFTAFGGLSKIPATVILATAIIPIANHHIPIQQRIAVLIALLVSVSIILLWYFYWEPHLLETYHNQLYYPRKLVQGLRELVDMGFWTMDKFTFVALQSYVSLGAFFLGLYYAIRNRNKLILLIFTITATLFIGYMLKTGNVFSNHTYYVIPFVPVMALLGEYGLASLPKLPVSYGILLIIGVESLLNQHHDFQIKAEDRYKLNLEQIADLISNRDDLIAVNGGFNPQLMYFLHRKGWSIPDEYLEKEDFIEQIRIPAFFLVRFYSGCVGYF